MSQKNQNQNEKQNDATANLISLTTATPTAADKLAALVAEKKALAEAAAAAKAKANGATTATGKRAKRCIEEDGYKLWVKLSDKVIADMVATKTKYAELGATDTRVKKLVNEALVRFAETLNVTDLLLASMEAEVASLKAKTTQAA